MSRLPCVPWGQGYSKMVDEMNKKLLEVLLDRRHLFMVVIPKSKSIGDLRAEVQNVACEMFTEFRGEVSTLETKNGARLPFKYEVGELLANESGILAYSSDYKMSTNGKRKHSSSRGSEEQLSKGKRKRTIASFTANGHVRQCKNTYNSVGTFMDKCVEDDNSGLEENDGIELSVNALSVELSGDGEEQNELLESEGDSVNRNNDMEVDEIKRKLCFSECSGVQNTKTRSSSTAKHKSRKKTITISREEECRKPRKIGDGENKRNKSQRSMVSHNEKGLKGDTVHGENCESAESSGSLTNVSDNKDTDEYNREGNLQHRSSYLAHRKQSEHHGSNHSNKQPGDRMKGKEHDILRCSQAMENTVPELKSNDKPQGTETELSQDKGTALQTRNTVPQQAQPRSRDCAFLRISSEDKSIFKKEPESLVGDVAMKLRGNTGAIRNASDVQRQGLKKARDGVSKEPGARTASDGVSVEAILSASKFRDLFSFPENIRSKRKEAIETSASKVACWLYTSNVSPATDEQYVRDGTAEDSDRKVEVEGLPNYVRTSRATCSTPRKQAAKRIASGHNNGDDNGDCGDDLTEHADSDADSNNSKQTTTANSFREHIGQTKQKVTLKTRPGDVDGNHSIKHSIGALQEKEVCEMISFPETSSPLRSIGVNRSSDKRLSTSSLGSVTQTCQVKIKKLPVCSEGGKLKVMWDSATVNPSPSHEHNGSSVDEDDGEKRVDKRRKSNPCSRPLISPNKNEDFQEESRRIDYVAEVEGHASTPTRQLRCGVKTTGVETRKAKDLEVLAVQSRDGQQDSYSSDAKTRKDKSKGDLIQIETVRPNDEKDAEALSASNNLHSITVQSSSRGQVRLRRSWKEVCSSSCSETSIDSDSESSEQDVVNKRIHVIAQIEAADGIEHREAPHLTEQITRKDANSKEETLQLRMRSDRSSKQATIKEIRNESSSGDDYYEHEQATHVTEEIARKYANSKEETLQPRIRCDCSSKQATIKEIRNKSSSGDDDDDDDDEHEDATHVTEEIAKKDANLKEETLQLRIRSDCSSKQAMIEKIGNKSSSGIGDNDEHVQATHVTEQITRKDANSKEETLQLRIRSDCSSKQATIEKIRNESSSGDDDDEHEDATHVTEEISKKDANLKEETLQLRIRSDCSSKQAMIEKIGNKSSSGIDDNDEHVQATHVTEQITRKDANSKEETLQLRIRSDCSSKQATIEKIRNESSSGDDYDEHEEATHVTEEIAKKDANSSDYSDKQARCNETKNEYFEKAEHFVVSKVDLSPSKANISPLACSKHSPSASLHGASCDNIETTGQFRIAEGSPTKNKASNTDALPFKKDLELLKEDEDEALDTEEESNGKKVLTADRENKDHEENGDSESNTESTLEKREQSNKYKLFIPESTFPETGEKSGNLNVSRNKRYTNTGVAETLRTSRKSSNLKSDGKSGKSNLKYTDWKDLDPAEQLSSDEQENHKMRGKAAENVKSQNASRSTVEQSGKVNSIASEQEEYANGVNKNKEHRYDNNGLTSNFGTVDSVNPLHRGKRTGKHSNTGPAEDTSDVKGRAELVNSWKPSSSQRKQPKGLLSLLDLAEEGDEDNTTVNCKALTSPRKTVQSRLRQFRQTPKGFCHTIRRRKLSASTSSVHICHIRRKPLKTSGKKIKPRDMTSKEIELSMEQVLADDSIWDK